MRNLHVVVAVLLCALMSACGGGGGGGGDDGGGGSTTSLPSISLSQSFLSARFTTGQPGSLTVVATASQPANRAVFVTVVDSAGIISPQATITATSDTTYSVQLTTAPALPPRRLAYSTAGNPMAPVIDPSGRFMFVVNEAPDSVVSFRIDAANGALTLIHLVPTGTSPRAPALVGRP